MQKHILTKLPLQEWLLVAVSIGSVLAVVFTSFLLKSRVPELPCCFIPSQPIVIEITGAVARPGSYSFPPGITYKRILRKVKPLKCADRSARNSEERFFDSCSLVIKEKQVKKKSRSKNKNPSE